MSGGAVNLPGVIAPRNRLPVDASRACSSSLTTTTRRSSGGRHGPVDCYGRLPDLAAIGEPVRRHAGLQREEQAIGDATGGATGSDATSTAR